MVQDCAALKRLSRLGKAANGVLRVSQVMKNISMSLGHSIKHPQKVSKRISTVIIRHSKITGMRPKMPSAFYFIRKTVN
jgi:hypothetical protein